jgi:aspartate aminotransferase
MELVRRFLPGTIHVPKPTWITHHAIIKDAGLNFVEYPYYNPKNKDFDFTAMMEYLNKIPSRSVVILHAAAHNPTGKEKI